jgi:ABC-type branched-subunit amino acid transport system ATPase component/ABC-type branched-subunit amino acid transport system permease subunit
MSPLATTLFVAGPALQGIVTGLTYGLLAIGLILVYRSSRVINFAQGAAGALGAAVLGVLVVNRGLPYWLVFPLGIVVGAVSGMLVETVAVRRLRKAPPAMSIVATLGMAAFLTSLSSVVNRDIVNGAFYPQPPGLPTFTVGPLLVSQAYAAELIFTPLVVLAIGAFLRWTRYGIAIRAAAENREAATLSGIVPGRMSSVAWGLGGSVAAYAAILQFPSQGFIGTTNLGTGLLLRALVAAVAARMTSLPIALAAGALIGYVEEMMLWNGLSGGQVELVLLIAIFVLLLAYSTRGGRDREQGSWLTVQAWPKPPDAIARLWTVRHLGRICTGLLVVLLLLGATLSSSGASTLTTTLAYTLVGISVFITCGLVGQLSLGQFALAGVGALISYQLSSHGVDFTLSLFLAALLTAPIAALLAVTALRLRGLMLTVVTLALAVTAQAWLFGQPWAFGDGVAPGRPIYGGFAFDDLQRYYLYAIPIFLIGLWLAWNVTRGGLRRAFVAVRDNEDAARAFGVPATRRKLQAFAISGMLAGLGGALYAHGLFRVSAATFPADAGITVVAMSAIGGLSLMSGSLVGALYLVALPQFVHLDATATATSTFGWLLLVLYFPGGVAQLLRPVHERLIDLIARLHGVDPVAARAADSRGRDAGLEPAQLLASGPPPATPASTGDEAAEAAPLLEVQEITKHFGGVTAVDGVSFSVGRGEVLGLIGPNGAGKTTLFEIVGGFVKPDAGRIVFDGRDVSRLAPERRAAAGLVRSFQDARLFPTMSVLEVVQLALERERPTQLPASLVGWRSALRGERAKRERALELIALMGLDRYRDTNVGQLSTGTRRIAELACLVGLQPRLLLLDEPSAGLAQRETEALGELLLSLRAVLDATVIVIEHDMPLITSVSDRVLAMHLGRRIAIGDPHSVVTNREVVASYLGDDGTAIARSGRTPTTDTSTTREFA